MDKDKAASDNLLLNAYIRGRSEADTAFAELVARHGYMVYNTCLRILDNPAEAEDAAQAVFIVLARKAGSIKGNIKGFLHGVAVNVSRQIRDAEHRRRLREKDALTAKGSREQISQNGTSSAGDIRPIIDENIARLPGKQRTAVMLHLLEGMGHREMAQALNVTESTARTHLQLGLKKLRTSLSKRGIGISGAVLASLFSGASADAACPSVLKAAAGQLSAAGSVSGVGETALSAHVHSLAEGVLKMMFWAKVKTAAAVTAAAIILGIGAAGTHHVLTAGEGEIEPKKEVHRKQPAPWTADPFRDTEAIEVKHGENSYTIDNRETVKKLLSTITINMIRNDVYMPAKATAYITFKRRDKKDYRVSLSSEGVFMVRTGLLHVSQDFIRALNSELTRTADKPINVLKFNVDRNRKPRKKLTRAMLSGGLKKAVIRYEVGDKPREFSVTDKDTLKALSDGLKIKGTEGDRELDRSITVWAEFRLTSNEGPVFWGHFQGKDRLRSSLDNLLISEDLYNEIEQVISKTEGRTIDILHDNPMTAQEQQVTAKLENLFRNLQAIEILTDDQGEPVNISLDSNALKKVLKKLEWVRPHPKGFKPFPEVPSGLKIRCRSNDGSLFTVTFMNKEEEMHGRIILGSPVVISGLGQAWVDDQWQYEFRYFLNSLKDKIKGKRQMQAMKEVMHDFPAFLKQVRCITFTKGDMIYTVPAGGTVKKICSLLSQGKAKQQKTDLSGLSQKPLLQLTPGIGFDLPLLFADADRAVVPGWGTIEFSENVLDTIHRIVRKDAGEETVIKNSADAVIKCYSKKRRP